MAEANPRTTSDTCNSDRTEMIFPPLGQTDRGLVLDHSNSGAAATTCYLSGDSISLANSVDGSVGSTFQALEAAAPLREPSARSVRRLKRQAAAEAAATAAAAVGSVATVLHEPNVAAATAGVLSAPRSAIGTAVASVPPAVHEPAVAVATADALTSAPRSAVGTAMASVATAVHEPAVAVATADLFASALSSFVAAAVASTGTAVHGAAVVYASPDVFAPAPYSAAPATASAVALRSSFVLLLGLGATPPVLIRAHRASAVCTRAHRALHDHISRYCYA